MVWMSLLCLIQWLSILILTVLGTWYSLRHFSSSRQTRRGPALSFPPISILKPLKGLHSGLAENLESFFLIDYPKFEILFSVADSNDPVIGLVKDLMSRFPEVAAELIIGDVKIGANPKVNNLIYSYHRAHFDWVMINDSNIRVDKDYLWQAASEISEKTGVVTAVIAGSSPRHLGGHLEALHLNSFCARGMFLAMLFGRPCVMGKSMLIRRSTVDRFGGIEILSQYLAEDYMTAQVMQHLNLQIKTMSVPVNQHIDSYSFQQFWSRHVRWGRIRKCHAPAVFLLELITNSFYSSFVGAWALHTLLQTPFWEVFGLSLLFYAINDHLILHAMRQPIRFFTPLVWALREMLWLPLWIATAANNQILWQGHKLHLKHGGLVEAVQ